jgi:hypothetical protein
MELTERMEVLMKHNWRNALVGAAATLVTTLAMTGSASAGLVVKTTTDCPQQPLSQPFAPWGDNASYQLVPGGAAESSAGWKLTGSARVVSGNEPWKVHGSGDRSSIRVPSGSSATTAPICVGLGDPTVRFFAKKNSGLLSTLAVFAVLRPSLGGELAIPVGVVLGGGSWKPSLPFLFLGNLLPLVPGQYTPVSFRFTPVLGGDWQIDDVYVDPMRSR